MQCLVKEPVYESIASRGSYGRKVNLGQINIFLNLQSTSKGYTKSILELDIEKCFDKIDHQKLMSMINLPKQAKQFLWSALRAGVLKERFITTAVPQGEILPYYVILLCTGSKIFGMKNFAKQELN